MALMNKCPIDGPRLVPGVRVRNKKTKNIYIIDGFSTDSETQEERILYYREDKGEPVLWDRPLKLFLTKFEIWPVNNG